MNSIGTAPVLAEASGPNRRVVYRTETGQIGNSIDLGHRHKHASINDISSVMRVHTDVGLIHDAMSCGHTIVYVTLGILRT